MAEFGSSRERQVPEGMSPESNTWLNMARMISDGLADSWFEDLKPQPASQVLSRNEIGELDVLEDYLPQFFGENPRRLLPSLELKHESLGELVPLESSNIGKALVRVLTKYGVSWYYNNVVPISHVESIEIPDLNVEGRAQWATGFGLPFDQVFRVYKNASGKESLTWSTDLIASTRPFEHIKEMYFVDESTGDQMVFKNDPTKVADGGLTVGSWSTKIVLPWLLKVLFYLAETPFPSNILTFSRDIAFGNEINARDFPKPYFMNKHNARIVSAYDMDGDGFTATAQLMPNVIETGWVIDTTDESAIETIIVRISEGLVRMMTIVEDGYLNHRSDESPFPFDFALWSAVVLDSNTVPGDEAWGLSCWVPVPRLGLKLHATMNAALSAMESKDFDDLMAVALNGAGPYVTNVINTLVFTYLLDTDNYLVDRILASAFLMNVQGESTNAMSNWGIVSYKRGDIEGAISRFEVALDQVDKNSEAEASWYLAKIYGELGNSVKSREYAARCEAAGGYDDSTGFAPGVEVRASVDPQPEKASEATTPPSSVGQAKFCGECGSKFVESAKFCQNCGASRA